MAGLSPEAWHVVRRLQALSRERVSERFQGSFRSVFRGEGLEFAEVREYQDGDDVRTVDWNVTARTGRPHVKRFEEERSQAFWLVIDVSASMTAGFGEAADKHLAGEATGVLSVSATLSGNAVGALLFDRDVVAQVPLARGVDHAFRIVRESVRPVRVSRTRLEPALSAVLRCARRHSAVFVISDFLDPEPCPSLAVAARKFDLVGLHARDSLAPLRDVRALVTLQDPETGEHRSLDLANASVREFLLAEEERRTQEWSRRFRQVGAGFVSFGPDTGLAPLLEYFQGRGRRS